MAGFEAWLLKFDGVGLDGAGFDTELGASYEYGRIEYAYSLMARAAGIDMMPTRLLEEGGRAHFMTRRFDRPGGTRRLHTQTLCALSILDYNARGVHDYAQLFQTIDALGLDESARIEAYRRLVFNWMAANCDDHTKNHSFVLDDRGHWTLSPAYDLTHAFNPSGKWTYQHLMSVGGKFSGLTRSDLIEFAERQGVPAPGVIIAEVADALGSWSDFAAEAGVTAATTALVRDDFQIEELRRQ